MRHRWVTLVARDEKITGAVLRVAVLIWEHMNKERGYAWPSLAYISREMKLNRSIVVRAIKTLDRLGWINRRRGTRGIRSNEYRLSFGSIDEG